MRVRVRIGVRVRVRVRVGARVRVGRGALAMLEGVRLGVGRDVEVTRHTVDEHLVRDWGEFREGWDGVWVWV